MNKIRFGFALGFGILAVAAASSQAATYYIDYVGGSDSNNGTSTATPWKRHPYMSGWSGSYSHQAGDRFIFKGGVTWPSACWTMNISTGGSAAASDYYGVSASWYAGTSWTRPIFDGERSGREQIYLSTGIKYLIFDGLEFINAQQCANIECTSPSYTTITNCYIHKWYGDGLSDTWNSNAAGIRNFAIGSSLGYTNFLITHCEIGNDDGAKNCGSCVVMPSEVAFSKIHDAPNQILFGGASIHDCEIYHNNESYMTDAGAHPDVVYWAIFNGRQPYVGNCYFYNNWIHDIRGGSGILPVLYVEAGFGAPITGEFYIFNNVFTSCTNPAVFPDNEGNSTSGIKVHVWNNTFAVSYPAAIVGSARGGVPQFGLLDMRNNHVIGSSAEWDDGAGVFVSHSSANAVVQTTATATAQGYTMANLYSPQNGSGATIMAGANLTAQGIALLGQSTTSGGYRIAADRPASGAWDAGAYLYGGVVRPPGTNQAPVVSPLAQSVADADPSTAGIQVLTGTTVQYSGSASDPNGDLLSWQWIYSVNGGGEVIYQSGIGSVSSISYAYGAGQAGNVFTWKLRVNDGQATAESSLTVQVVAASVPSGTLSFVASAGTITAPFATSGDLVYQSAETPLASSGRAAYSFTLTNAGYYVVQTMVNAPGDAANSFYINIDAEPQDPYMVWDIPVTTGVQSRLAAWRGNGTFDNNQFTPKVFNLAAGAHQLIIRGREAGVQLQSVTIVRAPEPPRNLRVVAIP